MELKRAGDPLVYELQRQFRLQCSGSFVWQSRHFPRAGAAPDTVAPVRVVPERYRAEYRKFKVKTAEGKSDDFASMNEVWHASILSVA
jgi:excinuclease UvrABC nuclease subunit